MPKDASFNEELVRQLAEILKETDLTEIEYEVEGCRIKVARQIQVSQQSTVAPQVAPAQSAQVVNLVAPSAEGTSATQDLSKHPGALKSPMVGNVYLSPSPGADPFVKVGQKVSQGESILIIEAMKVMNPIKAPKDGVVKQILVQDGEPIEYDQVLMVIE
jgi:acetyl-CoA carboxylase biotin carboxyl carrier protein